jgi:hypothetical protein
LDRGPVRGKPDDPRRRRLVELLRMRQAIIDRLRIVSAEQPAGDWTNAFASSGERRITLR